MAKHASEAELLLYVDGELKPRQAEWVREHLQACWECRGRCEQTERAICEFVEYRRAGLGSHWEGPPGGWPNLGARLSRLATESGNRAAFSALKLSPSPSLRLVSVVLVCLVAVALWRFTSVRTVSAKEFLESATKAESESIRRVQRPVVHQKLAVRRRSTAGPDQAGTLEIWSDVERVQLKRQGSDPLWQELQQVFQANRMAGKPPLSAAAYQSWRVSIDRKQEEVLASTLADGTQAWTLKTTAEAPFDPQEIMEGELTVRAWDWRPVRETLRVQGATEIRQYELTAIAFDIVARNSLPPDLFAERRVSLPPLRPPRLARPIALPPVQPAAVVQNESAELEAVYALHRLEACRGEAIEVIREATGEAVVRGVAETIQRKSELLHALEMVRGLKFQIETAEEVQEPPPWPGMEETPAMIVETPPLPIGEALAKYFAQQPGSAGASSRVAAVSDEAVSLARELLADAWALRRLAERFPAGEKQMGVPWRWLLEEMARDHLASLQAKLARTRALLEPVLASVAHQSVLAEGAAGFVQRIRAESGWPGSCLEVFRRVERIHTLVNGLLAGTGGIGEPVPAAAELLAAFPQAEKQLVDTDALVARGFSEAAGPADEKVAKK